MNFISAIKTILGVAGGVGGSVIIDGLIAGTKANSKGVMKACVTVAEFAIAGMVSDKIVDYVDKTVDEVKGICDGISIKFENKTTEENA